MLSGSIRLLAQNNHRSHIWPRAPHSNKLHHIKYTVHDCICVRCRVCVWAFASPPSFKIFVRARLCASKCMSYGIAGPCVLQEVVYVSAPVSTPIQRLFICLAASAGRSDQLRHALVDKLRRAGGAAIEAVWLWTTFHCSPRDKDRWIHLLAVQIQDAEYCRQRCLYGAPLCIVDVFLELFFKMWRALRRVFEVDVEFQTSEG